MTLQELLVIASQDVWELDPESCKETALAYLTNEVAFQARIHFLEAFQPEGHDELDFSVLLNYLINEPIEDAINEECVSLDLVRSLCCNSIALRDAFDACRAAASGERWQHELHQEGWAETESLEPFRIAYEHLQLAAGVAKHDQAASIPIDFEIKAADKKSSVAKVRLRLTRNANNVRHADDTVKMGVLTGEVNPPAVLYVVGGYRYPLGHQAETKTSVQSLLLNRDDLVEILRSDKTSWVVVDANGNFGIADIRGSLDAVKR